MREKGSIGYIYAFKQEPFFWHILWLHLGYHVFFILYNLLCVHVSLWISHYGVHLETYIHKSSHLLSWYPRSLPIIPLIHLVFGCVVKNLIYECLVYFNWILLHLYLLNAFGLKSVSSKCYRGSEDSIFVHIILNTNIILYAQTLGSVLISFRSPISLLSLYLVLSIWFFGSFDFFLLLLKFVLLVILFAIYDTQYGLSSSTHSYLDKCIWLHSFYEKCTLWGGTHPIFVSKFLHPFWYVLSMGEKFRGFKGNGFIINIDLFLSVCLSCISYLLCVAWLNIYSGNSPKG
jgi:hypothetical protein